MRYVASFLVLMAFFAATLTQIAAESEPAAPPAPALVPSTANERGTRLVLLGTVGGPVIRVSRSETANLLVVDGRPYLIDCGEGTVRRLAGAGFDPSNIARVFLTHHHIDHTSGLPSLLEYNWINGNRQPVEIYGPPGTVALTKSILDYLAIPTGIHKDEFPPQVPLIASLMHAHDVDVDSKKLIYQDDKIRVFAVMTTHYSLVHAPEPAYGALKAYAYRFETPDWTYVFTGDTGPSDAVAELARGADVLVSEVVVPDLIMEYLRKSFDPAAAAALSEHMQHEHLQPAEVGKLAARAGVKLVVLEHLSPAFDGDQNSLLYTSGVRKYFAGPVIQGQDLDQF